MRAHNTNYYSAVHADMEVVLNHFPDLKSKSPIGIMRGGVAAAFDKTVISQCLPQTGQYVCAVNLCWLSIFSVTQELPLSAKKKLLLQNTYYNTPSKCKMLTIDIDKDTDVKEIETLISAGQLQVCFPIEHLHAWWAGFAQAVKAGDPEKLEEWEKTAVSSIVSFEHMTSESIQWQSMQQREDLSVDFEALRCTPLMRVLNFGAFKARQEEISKGKLSASDLPLRYKQHLNLGPRSEKLTPGWVDQACTFLNRMYVIPSVAALLNDADDLPSGSNPLEGTSKLQAVTSKARSADKIALTVEHIMDMHKAGLMPTPPPLAQFIGTAPGCQGKGIVDLILFK